MRFRNLAVVFCSLGLLAGCGAGNPSIVSNSPKQQVAATAAYTAAGTTDEQQRAIAGRVSALRTATVAALKAAPVKSGTLGVTIPALDAYDALVAQIRTTADPSAKAQLAARADQLTKAAVTDLAQAKDPWGDPDQELKTRLATLKREYEHGTFGWREYNEARVTAILRAYGASSELRLDELEDVYRDGGLQFREYNTYRLDILANSYGTALGKRLELLERIYRDGGVQFREYNDTRVRMIMQAYGEPIDNRLAFLEDVYRDGGLTWQTYNQARLDLIAKAYDQRLVKRLDLLEVVYREGGMTFKVYNETRVAMIMDARYEPLQTRLDLLEAAYNDGGLTWASYQQYRKQLLAEG